MFSEVTNVPPIQEYHAAAQDNLDSEVDSTNKGIQAKERQARQKEKIKQQLRFFEDVTLADVTIDGDNSFATCLSQLARWCASD